MSTYATSNRVMHGPFVGRMKAELEGMLRSAQEELADGGGSTTGFSINGESAQKTPGVTVLQRIRLIQAALSQVDPDYIAPSHQMVTRFGPRAGFGTPGFGL